MAENKEEKEEKGKFRIREGGHNPTTTTSIRKEDDTRTVTLPDHNPEATVNLRNQGRKAPTETYKDKAENIDDTQSK